MDAMRKLEEIFARFPGIGPRQARRFVYHLLNKQPSAIKEFVQLIEEIKKQSAECSRCHRYFLHNEQGISSINSSSSDFCSICVDPMRDRSLLMVVARDSDFESVEKSGAYKGLYFILGGTVPVLDKEPEKRIRLKALLERVDQEIRSAGSVDSRLREIILSLNTTSDGEHTTDIVKEAIDMLLAGKSLRGGDTSGKSLCHPIATTILGRGLSTGAELEYVDGETIVNALKNRR